MRKLLNEELGRMDVDSYKQSSKHPFVLVLDNIRSLNNIGSAFRTGDAFRVEAIYLCGITACPPHREIQKTALGATQSVDWLYFDNTLKAVEKLQSDGYRIVAVEQADQSTSLPDFEVRPNEKLALVFGNEVKGVEEEVVKIADEVIEIPQFGTKHSLNISVSIGVVLWDLYVKNKRLSR